MTVSAAGIRMNEAKLINLGRDTCTYLRNGHSALDAIFHIVANGRNWSPDKAAVLVGAAAGTLCEDQQYKTQS